MANVASVLRAEISRIARKEVRSEILGLKKGVGAYRSEIAALKRRTQALEQQLRRLVKEGGHAAVEGQTEAPAVAHRFSAKRLSAHRRRLGLSAADFGRLLGVSAQSIYNWEEGKARPRASHLAALAALRTLGKKAAASHLAGLASAPAR